MEKATFKLEERTLNQTGLGKPDEDGNRYTNAYPREGYIVTQPGRTNDDNSPAQPLVAIIRRERQQEVEKGYAKMEEYDNPLAHLDEHIQSDVYFEAVYAANATRIETVKEDGQVVGVYGKTAEECADKALATLGASLERIAASPELTEKFNQSTRDLGAALENRDTGDSVRKAKKQEQIDWNINGKKQFRSDIATSFGSFKQVLESHRTGKDALQEKPTVEKATVERFPTKQEVQLSIEANKLDKKTPVLDPDKKMKSEGYRYNGQFVAAAGPFPNKNEPGRTFMLTVAVNEKTGYSQQRDYYDKHPGKDGKPVRNQQKVEVFATMFSAQQALRERANPEAVKAEEEKFRNANIQEAPAPAKSPAANNRPKPPTAKETKAQKEAELAAASANIGQSAPAQTKEEQTKDGAVK